MRIVSRSGRTLDLPTRAAYGTGTKATARASLIIASVKPVVKLKPGLKIPKYLRQSDFRKILKPEFTSGIYRPTTKLANNRNPARAIARAPFAKIKLSGAPILPTSRLLSPTGSPTSLTPCLVAPLLRDTTVDNDPHKAGKVRRVLHSSRLNA